MENQSFLNEFMSVDKSKSGMFFCTAGSADILINDQMFHMQRGCICMITPIVSSYLISKSPDFEGEYILDDMEVLYPVIHSMINTLIRLKLRDNPCIQLDEADLRMLIERKKIIDSKRRQLEDVTNEEEKYIIRTIIHLIVQQTMFEVMHIHFRKQPLTAHPIEKNAIVFYNFMQSLHVNFKKERSVSFYANEQRLSVGYFTSVIKSQTGRTPSAWIATITIIHAKFQLERTEKNIKEIAGELNFPEQFTFRKYFKQHTGQSPKEYRLQNKKL